MAKYATNASGAMLLLNSIQVTESISGSVVPLANPKMFEGAQLTILPQKTRNCVICLLRDKSAHCTSQIPTYLTYLPDLPTYPPTYLQKNPVWSPFTWPRSLLVLFLKLGSLSQISAPVQKCFFKISLAHCIICCFYRRRLNLHLLRPRCNPSSETIIICWTPQS